MAGQIEHANISVNDVDEAIRFFQTAFPDWKIRGGAGDDERRWVHLGSDDTYLWLNGPTTPDADAALQPRGYVNHIGFTVDDAKAVRQRMLDAGFRDGYKPEFHEHRTRVYILDADGREYEFVQYHSDDPAERNQYS